MHSNLSFKAADIARIVRGTLIGNPEIEITNLNRLDEAKNGDLCFLNDPMFEKFLKDSPASCVIISQKMDALPRENQAYIKADNPHNAFVAVLQYLDSKKDVPSASIHPTAIIDSSSTIASSAFIGPYCVIGKNCKIGKNTVLKNSVTLYDNVSIADNTFINANVTLYEDTIIGNNCILHAGVVVGSDGFGYIEHKDGKFEKIPQLGNVIIHDDVELGANTTIDRAMTGSTVIENGVKLDNMVQIGHNVRIGEHSAMAAQAGVAGTTTVGKRNRFGGQCGLAGHMTTCDDVVLIAQSGVPKSITEKGIYFGTPIKDRLKAFKIEAVLNHLPDMYKEFQTLKEKVNNITSQPDKE
jgi:UDP-3-O-[3-hydroxymyristoyl] glucosamine N-acyltransferase